MYYIVANEPDEPNNRAARFEWGLNDAHENHQGEIFLQDGVHLAHHRDGRALVERGGLTQYQDGLLGEGPFHYTSEGHYFGV